MNTSNSKNKKSKTQTKNSLDLYKFGETPQVIISNELASQVNWLHQHTNKKEWSGILLYEILEGSIEEPEKMKIKAQRIFLMDLGTSASTEYENDVDSILDMDEQYPQFAEGDWQMGHIHSHHDMKQYFSQTDMGELQDNAKTYNYYLSLIVGHSCEPVAKIAMECEMEPVTFVHKGTEGNPHKKKEKGQKMLGIYNCDVEYEVDETTRKRLKDLKEKNRRTVVRGFNNYQGYGWPDQQQNVYPLRQRQTDFTQETGKRKGKVKSMTKEHIDKYLYKLLSLNHKTKATLGLGELIEQLSQSMKQGDQQSNFISYIAMMDEFVWDVAKSYIGEGNFLTDDEWEELLVKSVERLEDYKGHDFVDHVIELLEEDYLHLVEDVTEQQTQPTTSTTQ